MSWAVFGVALLELDATHVGQFMISRPLVFGPALGLLLGRPDIGITFGILFELFTLEDLPVGVCVVPSATVSAGSAILLASGLSPLSIELAFPAGLLVGRLHRLAEVWIRRRREGLARGLAERPSRAIGLGISQYFAVTAATMSAAAFVLKPALAWATQAMPVCLGGGIAVAFYYVPLIGAAALMRIFIRPSLGKA